LREKYGRAAHRTGARRGGIPKTIIVLLPLFALPAIWSWTPLNEWINLATIIGWQESVRSNPAAPYLVAGAYVVGSLVFFPVTVLTIATVFTFGPVWGNVYGFVGWMLSASVGYGLGRLTGHGYLRALASAHVDRLLRQAGRHGFIAVLTMRVLPVAPFTLVNLFVGASLIRFRDFFSASVLGRIPGMVALSLLGFQVESLLRKPGVESFAALGLVIAVVALGVILISWRFKSRDADPRHTTPRQKRS
jgi:phospholipase D1/2